MPPEDFSAATLLYLNPELPAFSNVTTVEEAFDRYASDFSNLHYSIPEPALVGPFADDMYIAEHRGEIDVSWLNHAINVANSNILHDAEREAGEVNDIYTRGKFVPNFYREIKLESENTFSLVPLTQDEHICTSGLTSIENLTFNESNIRLGDEVKILKNDGREIIYGTVEEIIDDSTFKIKHHDDAFPVTDEEDAEYVLFGIRVSDPMRVAHVNYTRRFHAGFSNEAPTHALSPFNAELYQVLYPDARFLTEEEAFISSRNNWTTNEARITKADDILTSVCPVIETMRITSNLDIASDAVVTWGPGPMRLTGVSSNFVDASDVDSSQTTQFLTEYASKRYTEIPYETTATFNDVVVNGKVTLANGMDMQDGLLEASNLRVDSMRVGENSNFVADPSNVSVNASDFECSCNVIVRQSGFANMLFAGTRIGLGGGEDSANDWPDKLAELSAGGNQDRGAANLDVQSKLVLGGGRWQLEAAGDTGNLVIGHATALKHPLVTFSSNSPEGGRGAVTVDGDLYTTGVVMSLSDTLVKHDMLPIENPVQKVKELVGYTYVMTNDIAEKERSTGLLAQDVARVLPEATRIDKRSGNMSVAYGNLCGLLVEAIKNVSEQLDRLSRRMDAYDEAHDEAHDRKKNRVMHDV